MRFRISNSAVVGADKDRIDREERDRHLPLTAALRRRNRAGAPDVAVMAAGRSLVGDFHLMQVEAVFDPLPLERDDGHGLLHLRQ